MPSPGTYAAFTHLAYSFWSARWRLTPWRIQEKILTVKICCNCLNWSHLQLRKGLGLVYQEQNNPYVGQGDIEFWESRRAIAIKLLSLGPPQKDKQYWSKQLFAAEARLATCYQYVSHPIDPEVSQVLWRLYLEQSPWVSGYEDLATWKTSSWAKQLFFLRVLLCIGFVFAGEVSYQTAIDTIGIDR